MTAHLWRERESVRECLASSQYRPTYKISTGVVVDSRVHGYTLH